MNNINKFRGGFVPFFHELRNHPDFLLLSPANRYVYLSMASALNFKNIIPVRLSMKEISELAGVSKSTVQIALKAMLKFPKLLQKIEKTDGIYYNFVGFSSLTESPRTEIHTHTVPIRVRDKVKKVEKPQEFLVPRTEIHTDSEISTSSNNILNSDKRIKEILDTIKFDSLSDKQKEQLFDEYSRLKAEKVRESGLNGLLEIRELSHSTKGNPNITLRNERKDDVCMPFTIVDAAMIDSGKSFFRGFS